MDKHHREEIGWWSTVVDDPLLPNKLCDHPHKQLGNSTACPAIKLVSTASFRGP